MKLASIIPVIYLAATIQGLFLSFFLFRTKVNQPANRILAVLLMILSGHLILVGFDNREFFMTYPHLSRISWIIGSLYWPLLYWFVQLITRTQPDKLWKSLWPLIPFVILLGIMLPYYMQSAEAKRLILDNFEEATKLDFGWINQVVSLLHIAFQVYFLIYYVRYERRLYLEFSEIESLRIKWLKQFLLASLITTSIAVISFFFRTWEIPVLSQLYSFHFIGVVLTFYWLSYKALTQPILFGIGDIHQQPLPAATAGESKYKTSGLSHDQLKQIFVVVKALLEEKRLYTNPDFTLTQLSIETDISKHQISQAINSSGQGNFFDLVNHYRIEEFKRLASLPEKKNLTILGIAQEAGFQSKATFYSVFKKRTGMTPSEYLEKPV